MVEWTDKERSIIKGIFGSMDYNQMGPRALIRCLIVYPWTQRYFGSFGNLCSIDAIKSNDKIAKHGVTVLRGLDRALDNMDNIKSTYTELSVLHSEKLHVDPDNFKLLSDCLCIEIAGKMGSDFTAEKHAAYQKFMSVVVSALGRQYH
ncbi:hemoglobin subunit beta-1-like [Cheilinus undulatus]|uniref:hemoglobin subunit beta-1-like n=1 Tax=Cheilinus undulatus TaxID=241271 RepID=UPI001BD586B9|nr:hemoglobin subunit beta-1-like [Cheilinus undulatus]